MRSLSYVALCALAFAGCSNSAAVPQTAALDAGASSRGADAFRTVTASPPPTPSPARYVYVANTVGNSIDVYPANPMGTIDEAPVGTIAGSQTQLEVPMGVAVDANYKIYAATDGGVAVFPANPIGTVNEAPQALIHDSGPSGNSGPNSIALDAKGKIYVANNWNSVTVYAANPSGNDAQPIATIEGSNTGLDYPAGIALDASGRIYVANWNANTVTVYAAHPHGTLDEKPIATIGGTQTTLNGAWGVAIDDAGKVYVSNTGTQTVAIFAANPTGNENETPVSGIGFDRNGTNTPFGIALDPTGTLYAAIHQNAVDAFAFSNGQWTESGAIAGTATQLDEPFGVAVR